MSALHILLHSLLCNVVANCMTKHVCNNQSYITINRQRETQGTSFNLKTHVIRGDAAEIQEETFDMEGQLTRGETYSESNSTNMSANMISRTEGCCQLIKEEPITAKQQIAVWLTKTSTQNIHQETDMSVMTNVINQKPNSSKHNTSPYCQPTTAWDESESSKEINRNANSKSRMGKSYPSSNY